LGTIAISSGILQISFLILPVKTEKQKKNTMEHITTGGADIDRLVVETDVPYSPGVSEEEGEIRSEESDSNQLAELASAARV
jgi:Tat protein secretion system quality control protein TatD with DNase activity